jgi:hypothetical protein
MMGLKPADRDIGIDTYGYDYDESLDDDSPADDQQEYDDDDPRHHGRRHHES